MTSPGDAYFIQQIRAGSADAWAQLVSKYHGRLIAFANSQLRNHADADDAVQETFVGLLRSLDRFQLQASLETFLFAILRRRIADCHRRHGREQSLFLCTLQDVQAASNHSDAHDVPVHLQSGEPSASWHAAQNEQQQLQQSALWGALHLVVGQLQEKRNLRDLMIFELIFYAQLRNRDIGRLMQLNERQVALVKHRFLTRLVREVGQCGLNIESADKFDDTLLSRLWEDLRPSCPKRSTIGKWVLGTLDPSWQAYVQFHLHQLGCQPCLANLEDVRSQTQAAAMTPLHQRIYQSTVGFLRRV